MKLRVEIDKEISDWKIDKDAMVVHLYSQDRHYTLSFSSAGRLHVWDDYNMNVEMLFNTHHFLFFVDIQGYFTIEDEAIAFKIKLQRSKIDKFDKDMNDVIDYLKEHVGW